MPSHSTAEIADHVSQCLQLAILLEVSAYPKPGNVHRTADFEKTRYEHFLASAVAAAPHFRYAAHRGIMVSRGKISPGKIKIGNIIMNLVESAIKWQSGGNTMLGMAILLSPVAVAAGMTISENETISLKSLRKSIDLVTHSTTSMDSVALYDAIRIAKPGGLGKAPKLDASDPAYKRNILNENATLHDVFKIASQYDSIAGEWINHYSTTFDIGYPYFTRQLKETEDINTATVNAFLKILSEVPDTLIARKVGLNEAREISLQAKKLLKYGGLSTALGRKRILEFDRQLREFGNKLNPGTTADMVTCVLALSLLEGFRP